LKKQREGLSSEVQKFKDCDPETLKVLKKEIELSKTGANRFLKS